MFKNLFYKEHSHQMYTYAYTIDSETVYINYITINIMQGRGKCCDWVQDLVGVASLGGCGLWDIWGEKTDNKSSCVNNNIEECE